MKILRFLAPAALVSGTALLIAPTTSDAFTLLGWNLNLNQRDLRVFNNFTDAAANNNTTVDDQFPGYDGAEVAMWKAAVEWGSVLHGDGTGDPSQPTSLGSGGANFDFSWQGNATGAGSIGNNIISETAGSMGGVLAVTTSFVNGSGWKMIFYSVWDWQDGPDIAWPSGGNRFDLQGIATHELGHSLGLGHSTVPGATMFASVNASTAGKFTRTIEADDRAGVQAIYGVAAATKPVITDLAFNGTNVSILGTNFAATNNEVWFTQAGSGGNGNPIKATNVPSAAGGTSITVALPAAAGSGDVLVRKAGGAHSQLSNAFPFDETDTTGCAAAAPTTYCAAIPNSTGQGVDLNWGGSQSLAADDLLLFGDSMPSSQFGIFISSRTQTTLPAGNGIVCVGLPFYRWGLIQADFLGLWSWNPPLNTPPNPNAAISAGETWNFQLWYRDPTAAPSDFNFSDGISIEFCN